MKTLPFLLLIFCSLIVHGQERCSTDVTELNNDEPPGCLRCSDNFIGFTTLYSQDSVSFDFPCGIIDNSQWFSLIPNREGTLKVTITNNICVFHRGVEAAIYDEDLRLVSNCETTTNMNVPLEIVAENLPLGKTFQLMVDGVGGDNCEFLVEIEGNFQEGVSAFEELDIVSDAPHCFGEEICFSIDSIPNVSELTFVTPDSTIEILVEDLQESFLCHEVTRFGQLSIWALNGCQSFINFSSLEEVIDTSLLFFVDTMICPGECFYFKDSCFIGEGRQISPFDRVSSNTCDSSLVLDIVYSDVFPSPTIKCQDVGGQLLVEWSTPSGAQNYVISINRDSFSTTQDNFIMLENLPVGTPINVKIQPSGSCSYLPAETNCILSASNTSGNFLENKITVFPNPTSGFVNIETELLVEEVEVYDATGRFLQKEKTASFDIKNRAAGIYFLKIKTNEGIAVKRVFCNKF